MAWESIRSASQDGRTSFNKGIESLLDRVQEATGLKLRDSVGKGKEAPNKVESGVIDAVKTLGQKVENVKSHGDASKTNGKTDPEKRLV